MKQKFAMPSGELVEKDMPIFKTPYNHDTNFESDRTGLYCTEPSLTKQEFKDECDINVILARYAQTDMVPPTVLPEHFRDFTNRTSYFEMSERVADAKAAFYTLDADVRAEYQNDPARWADSVVDKLQKRKFEALREMGIDIPLPNDTGNTPGGTPAPTSGEGGGTPPGGGKEPPKGAKAPD